MVFRSINWTPENAPQRTAEGEKSFFLPDSPFDVVKHLLPKCVECAKVSAHSPCQGLALDVPHGSERYDGIPSGQRFPIDGLQDIHFALWAATYINYGVPFTFYNLGLGNNIEQQFSYEIISVSGNLMTIRGREPRYMSHSNFILNPEYPPILPRLLDVGAAGAMPVGATVKFDYPSVYSAKGFEPWVTRVIPNTPRVGDGIVPETFQVELSADVSNAMRPIDLALGNPSEYRCRIGWHLIAPADLPNWQVDIEAQFSLRIEEKTPAEVDAIILGGGQYELLANDGSSTRIMWPDFFEAAMTVSIFKGSGTEHLTPSEIAERLLVTGTGPWVTTFDFTDLDYPDLNSIAIVYRPEAVATDDTRMVYAGSCANSQEDRSGSYVVSEGHYCTAPESTGFEAGLFRKTCWLPGRCDKFCMGNESGGYKTERMIHKRSDVYQTKWWAHLFSRASWLVEQGVPGVNHPLNFKIMRPAGAKGGSVQELLGSFQDEVFGGFYPNIASFFSPSMGALIETTDVDGTRGSLRHGAFVFQGGNDLSVDPQSGFIPINVGAAWNDKKDAFGDAQSFRRSDMPDMAARCDVYDFASRGSSYGRKTSLVSNTQKFLTGFDILDMEDSEVAELARQRFS